MFLLLTTADNVKTDLTFFLNLKKVEEEKVRKWNVCQTKIVGADKEFTSSESFAFSLSIRKSIEFFFFCYRK